MTDHEARRRSSSVSPRGFRVLVVDDDAGLIRSLTRVLEEANYAVVSANSLERGYEAFVRLRPDAVVTDHEMPGGTGSALLEMIKKKVGPDCPPLILLTAHRDVSSSSADLILHKPDGIDAVVPWLSELIPVHAAHSS